MHDLLAPDFQPLSSEHSHASPLLCVQAVGRFFLVKERNTTFTQELRGGMVTFLTVRCAWMGWGWSHHLLGGGTWT